MNNKQVPEIIGYKVTQDCTLGYTNYEAEEEIIIEDRCEESNWPGTDWFNSFPQIFEPIYKDGTVPNPASLPAEPSTPETKDKPATGSGATPESILEKHFPQLGWTNTVRNRALAAMEEYAAAKQPSPGGEEYATLRQPTGTVYVPTPIMELPDKDDWYTLVLVGKEKGVSLHAWYDSEHGWDIKSIAHAYKHYLKPIQFLPEREGEKMALPNAAQVLSGFIWKNEFPRDVIRGSIASGFEIHQQTLLTYLMKFVQFIEKGQSTGEGINE